ncbi:MAG: hypothetical protein K5927_08740, partial [Lachnospiraceae bacterium]|nr:hypothetical protein [Lachnospiraceae bacterium]
AAIGTLCIGSLLNISGIGFSFPVFTWIMGTIGVIIMHMIAYFAAAGRMNRANIIETIRRLS